jgi:hypothetical protein
MALPGEALDAISEGFTRILPGTLQVLGVVGSHIRVLEVAGEDPFEILPTIDCISWQVV